MQDALRDIFGSKVKHFKKRMIYLKNALLNVQKKEII